MIIAKIWIILNSLFYAWIGFYTLLKPSSVAAIVNYQLMTSGAIAEFKAMYGGLQLAIAVIMLILYKTQQFGHAVAFIGLVYLGYGSGRLIGIITNQAYDKTTLTYFAIELSCILISSIIFFKKLY